MIGVNINRKGGEIYEFSSFYTQTPFETQFTCAMNMIMAARCAFAAAREPRSFTAACGLLQYSSRVKRTDSTHSACAIAKIQKTVVAPTTSNSSFRPSRSFCVIISHQSRDSGEQPQSRRPRVECSCISARKHPRQLKVSTRWFRRSQQTSGAFSKSSASRQFRSPTAMSVNESTVAQHRKIATFL